MSKKHGTYLIEFTDGESIVCGNNYKPWWQHAVEYIYGHYKDPEHGWRYSDVAHVLKDVKFSYSPFIDDGGLKWATPTGYQEVIDDVSLKSHQAFTPFKDIKFAHYTYGKAALIKKLREY